MSKKWLTIILLFYTSIIVVIVSAILYTSPILKGQFRIVMQQEPEDLNPIFGSMSAASEVEGTIFKPMVQRDNTGKLIPVLVEEIPTEENGSVQFLENRTKIRVTWKFKKGLVWQDNHPLTPDDVIFTWKVIMHSQVQVESRDIERRIVSMKVDSTNPRHLIVIWKEPYAFYFIGHKILPKHILKKEFEKNPETLHLSPFNKNPIGNGPYKLKEWKLGTYILLERNEYFPKSVGQRAVFDTIFYQFIPNTNSMIVSIISKNTDALSPTGIGFDQILDFEKVYGKRFDVHIVDGITWEHIDINLDNPILKDKRVRQALLYAINRENIVKYLFYNKLQVSHSWLPPMHPGYHHKIKRKYLYNPKKARALLEKAGWKKKSGETRVNEKGEPLALTLMTTAGNKVRERVEVFIKEDLKKVGIKLTIKNQHANNLFGETLPKRKFPHLIMYAHTYSLTEHGEEMWVSQYIPSEKNKWFGSNTPGYVNKEIDRIHRLIPITLNLKERVKLFHRQQEILAEDLPTLPLYFRKEASITRKDLINWKLTGNETPVTWNCETWAFRK